MIISHLQKDDFFAFEQQKTFINPLKLAQAQGESKIEILRTKVKTVARLQLLFKNLRYVPNES